MPRPVLQPPEPKNGKKIKQHRNEPSGVNNGSRKETHPLFIVILRWQKKKTLSPSLQLVWCSEVSPNLLNKAAK